MNTYKNYIDLSRNIVKNFKYSNEFDDVIKRILDKIFNNYYVNRNKYTYCIDNLYKKYDVAKYNFIKKKYGICKKENLIFRFNRCNKKYYILKLLKENNIINDLLVEEILKNNEIKNYKKYIEDINFNKEDFKIILNERICFYTPCLNKIIGSNNYCHLHNKDSI